jgi:hypothetical protein
LHSEFAKEHRMTYSSAYGLGGGLGQFSYEL